MKYASILILFSCALVASAVPPAGYREPTIDQDKQQAAQASIKQLPDWTSLTNNLAQYGADRDDYTNKVGSVSDAQTKAAIKALAQMVADLKQAVADEKRLIKAIANSTTNNSVISQ